VSFQFRDGTVATKSNSSWGGFSYSAAQFKPVADVLGTISRTLGEQSGFVVPLQTAPMWLDDVYAYVQQQLPRKAVDILYEKVDGLLSSGEFHRCDELLRTIDLKRLDTNLIVSVLAMTKVAANELPYRSKLLGRARTVLESLAPGRVERLLAAL